MINFKDLNIKTEGKPFAGHKIRMVDLLNKEITVRDYKIKQSKFKQSEGQTCLHLSLEVDGQLRVAFCSGAVLTQQLEAVPRDKFPFRATIKKLNDWYEFT